jgi:hypothetical protein
MPTFANDKFRVVVLYAANRQVLAQFLLNRLLDIGPLRESPETREIEVELFVTEEQIAQLKKDGARLEVHENLSEVGRNRQKEVGRGDRFEAGKSLVSIALVDKMETAICRADHDWSDWFAARNELGIARDLHL